ncbi:MAG: SIS domain-containing protein [Actinomycetota bacterium]
MNDSIVLMQDAYDARARLVRSFFEAEAQRLAELCHGMARRFVRGGRLIAFGVGPAATDAQHVSVEFVHPVIVGKRALPALALPNDIPSALGGAVAGPGGFFARQLGIMARPEDIALGIVHGSFDPGIAAVEEALERATASGMLSVSLGATGGTAAGAQHAFEVDCSDPFVVQEVHETLYHVLWELVHVFFDHRGLLEDRPSGRAHDSGRSSFLYPFLAEDEGDLQGVLHEVRGSILSKAEDVIALRAASADPEGLRHTARLIAERVRSGGKVLALGNGGSATDAQDLVADLVAPPGDMSPVAALSLTNDAAVVTAVANDVGFDNVFARQVIAHGEPSDVVMAISTSGGSRNVVAAVEEARRRDLLTVALAGYGGGRLSEICDRAHPIDAAYIPRIQEGQATQYHLLRRLLATL